MGNFNTESTRTGTCATQTYQFMHDYSCGVIIRDDYVNRNSKSALALQIFINGARKVLRIGAFVNPEFYDKKRRRVKMPAADRERENELNLIITNAESKASKIFTHHVLKDKVLTIDDFLREYYTADLRINFLLYAHKISDGQKDILKPSTWRHQQLALKYLEEFKSPFMMYDITFENIRKFDEFLRKKINKRTGKRFGDNHIWKNHSKIRKFITNAIREGIEIEDPYKTFKVKKKPGTRECITKDELNLLINIWKENKLPPTHQEVLSAYIFSCTCGGFRISDLKLFDHDNLHDGKISYTPFKTLRYKNKIITLELPHISAQLIKTKAGKLFSLPSEQKFNLYIKSIGFMVGIRKNLTAHTARHTFATQYLEAGGNVVNLQQILGHSDIKDTMIYVHMSSKVISQSMSIMNVFSVM